MSILDGDIRDLFGSVFSDIWDTAHLVRVSQVSDGRGGGTETPSPPVSVRVQFDDDTDRESSGSVKRFTRVLVLQSGVVSAPDTSSYIMSGSRRLAVRRVDEDPARSYWELDCEEM